jgi:type VI secretion system secreted protein Hcp
MAFDMYLKIEGIDTEARSIDVESFSWGVSNTSTGAGGGGGAGKVVFQDLHISRLSDSVSPTLFKACATGQHFKKLELGVLAVNDNGKPELIYKLTLSDILVSSYQSGGAEFGSDRPQEQLAFKGWKVDFITK